MKKIILGFGASALIIASATSAMAHEGRNIECRQDRNNAAVAGGFLGAGAGAAIGKAVAATQVRPEGIVLGALVGAVVGANIGKDTVACADHNYTQNRGRSHGDHYSDHYYDGHRPIAPDHVVYYNAPPVAYAQPVAYAPAPQTYYSNQNVGWYQPSPYGYYGSGVQVSNSQQYYQSQVQVQEYSTGWQYVPAPVQYMPPVQYVPPMQPAPQPAPCGTWVCH